MSSNDLPDVPVPPPTVVPVPPVMQNIGHGLRSVRETQAEGRVLRPWRPALPAQVELRYWRVLWYNPTTGATGYGSPTTWYAAQAMARVGDVFSRIYAGVSPPTLASRWVEPVESGTEGTSR
jgi:hypothetical protein